MNKLPRFSLCWFLAGVAYLAFGCAAFMQPDGLTAILFQTLTWGMIVASLIACVVASEGTREKARGFAIASLLYVVSVYEIGPTFGPHELTEWLAARAQIKAAPYAGE